MHNNVRWQVLLGLTLVLLSAIFYFLHYRIFQDAHHIFIYLLGDIAFVPIEVLLVTMIIHKLLEEKEKKNKLEKLNMVIELFFSEAGTKLLTYLSDFDPDIDSIKKELVVRDNWSDADFKIVSKRLKSYNYTVDIRKIDLAYLRSYLLEKRAGFQRILENQVILEHESFTELLRAIFHLTEELANREDFSALPESDLKHLSGDIKRIYSMLVLEWLQYMKYLKKNYPFLFSLAVRTNPFDQEASPIVK